MSRICQGLEVQVEAFLNRPLEFSRSPYVYLDATYLHRRDPPRKQVISRAVIVAGGHHRQRPEGGARHRVMRLAISDAHAGL